MMHRRHSIPVPHLPMSVHVSVHVCWMSNVRLRSVLRWKVTRWGDRAPSHARRQRRVEPDPAPVVRMHPDIIPTLAPSLPQDLSRISLVPIILAFFVLPVLDPSAGILVGATTFDHGVVTTLQPLFHARDTSRSLSTALDLSRTTVMRAKRERDEART